MNNILSLSTEIKAAIVDSEMLHRVLFGKGITITEARSKRGYPSKHTSGNAIDIRIRHLTPYEQHTFTNLLRSKLGNQYDVVLESDHIHIEYDPPHEEEL